MSTERRITDVNNPVTVKQTVDKENSYFYGISFKEWEDAVGVEKDWSKLGVEDLKPFFKDIVEQLHRLRSLEK
jgi:hypothetical protein